MTFENKINKVHADWLNFASDYNNMPLFYDYTKYGQMFNKEMGCHIIRTVPSLNEEKHESEKRLTLAGIYLAVYLSGKNNNGVMNLPLYLDKCKQIMIEKNKQYGDAILNPKYFSITKEERECNLRGLINNKLNRIMNQTDDEDALGDLVNYIIFYQMLKNDELREKHSKAFFKSNKPKSVALKFIKNFFPIK